MTENAQKQILDLGQALPKEIRKRRISREKEFTNRVEESSERPTRERLEELIEQGQTGLAKRIILDYCTIIKMTLKCLNCCYILKMSWK